MGWYKIDCIEERKREEAVGVLLVDSLVLIKYVI
jgi:hypothetical protein